jgi:hypothetical protein
VLAVAAFCPHPPLLVPAVAAGAAPELDEVRGACRAAIDRFTACGVEEVVVLGAGERSGTARAGERGTLAGFGVPMSVSLGTGELGTGEDPGEARLPLSLTIGAWLLRESGYAGVVRGRVVAADSLPADLRSLGERIGSWPGVTGLLVMGDGSMSRSAKAPGYLDPRAACFDRSVVEALRAVDLEALSTLDPELSAELGAQGRAPWQVAAGAATDGRWQGEVLYDGAPYGVQYTVAVWTTAP